tara:strand:+ start:601 stop:1320 length:720 start_codon:yes stop_codon:yes gene_type:complete
VEKILISSYNLFTTSIQKVLPYILFYGFLMNFIAIYALPAIGETIENQQQINGLISYNFFFYLLLIYFFNSIYSILFTQFIISKIKNEKIVFNINLIFIFLVKFVAIDSFVLIFPIILGLIVNFTFGTIIGDNFLILIPLIYFITYFSKYLIIDKNLGISESLLTSYYIIQSRFGIFFKFILINFLFVVIILYTSILIGNILQFFSTAILNIQIYFISIFNIYFYYLIKPSNEIENIND